MDLITKCINIISKKEVYGVVITIILSFFIYHTIAKFLEKNISLSKSGYEKKKRVTITKLLKNIIKYIIVILATMTILSLFGVNIKGIVAGLGITATILGLALQDTLKDIINGINILSENYFIVGDIVSYNDFTGEIIEFGFRSTKIKNAQGEVLIVANRNIMEIKNISQEEPFVMLNIAVAYEENNEKVEKIIKEKILPKIEELDHVINDSAVYLGIKELATNAIIHLIKCRCDRETGWQIKRDANKIILEELNKNKIKIPYAQLEVHYDKKL